MAREAGQTLEDQVRDALKRLERRGSKRNRDGMARCGIVASKAFGVPMADMADKTATSTTSLVVHDKAAGDEPFAEGLLLIERDAGDERNFVKKAANWALRSIGKRSPGLNASAVATARRLSTSLQAAARWVGRHALRELAGPAVIRRLAARGPDPGGSRRRPAASPR